MRMSCPVGQKRAKVSAKFSEMILVLLDCCLSRMMNSTVNTVEVEIWSCHSFKQKSTIIITYSENQLIMLLLYAWVVSEVGMAKAMLSVSCCGGWCAFGVY